jgi:hypothetical protein
MVLLPILLKEILFLRFKKGGGAQANDGGCIDRGERSVSGWLNIGKLLSLPCSFSIRAWMMEHLVESDHVAFITRSFRLPTSSGALDRKELPQVAMSMLTSSIGV